MEKDICEYITNFLDLKNLINTSKISKYYYNLINTFPLMEEINCYKKKYLDHQSDFFKYTLSKKPLKIFEYCCENGWLNFAKYIFKNYKLNICFFNSWIFVIVCKNGYLEMAKWLLNVKQEFYLPIRIDQFDDWAFRYSCIGGHIKICQWLSSLDNKYYFEEKNGKIINYKIKN